MAASQFIQPIDLEDRESIKRLLIDLASTLGLVVNDADVNITSLASLQDEINVLKEEAQSTDDELVAVNKELKTLKDAQRNQRAAIVRGTIEDPLFDSLFGVITDVSETI